MVMKNQAMRGEKVKKPPDRIYLQIKDDLGNDLDSEEWTWCSFRVEKTDIVYISRDFLAKTLKPKEEP